VQDETHHDLVVALDIDRFYVTNLWYESGSVILEEIFEEKYVPCVHN
jgi:hypothetical protein